MTFKILSIIIIAILNKPIESSVIKSITPLLSYDDHTKLIAQPRIPGARILLNEGKPEIVYHIAQNALATICCTPGETGVETINYLETTLGRPRLERIAATYHLNLNQIEEQGLSWSDLNRLYTGLASTIDADLIRQTVGNTTDFETVDLAYRALYHLDHQPLNAIFLGRPPHSGLLEYLFAEKGIECPIPIPAAAGRRHHLANDRERVYQTQTLLQQFDEHDQTTDPEQLNSIRRRFIERMVMRIVFHHMDEGTILPWITADGRKAYYQIHTHLATDEGLFGFACTPIAWQKGPIPDPEIVIRGSQFDPRAPQGFASVLEDVRDYPGKFSAAQASPIIKELCQKPCFMQGNHRIHLTGMSLSGAQVQYIAAHLPHLISSVTTFSSPGIDGETRDLFNHYFETHPEEQIEIHHHRNFGDIVDLAGDYFLGHQAPDNVNAGLTVRGHKQQLKKLTKHPYQEVSDIEELFLRTSPQPSLFQALRSMTLHHGTEFFRRDPETIVTISRHRSSHGDHFDVYLSPERTPASLQLDHWYNRGLPKLIRKILLAFTN